MQGKTEQRQAANIRLRDLLEFYQSAGAEDALSETGFDAFSRDLTAKPRRAKAAPQPQPAAPLPPRPQTAPPPRSQMPPRPQAAPPAAGAPRIAYETWLERACAAAQAAQNLAELKQSIAAFDGCNLKFTAKNTCIADGSAPQRLMIVGEGPGAEEDRRALPFVGRAGQLLNAMLAAIHFSRESLQSAAPPQAAGDAPPKPQLAYITNAVFWRPPGNRNPTAEELALCLPFLQRQIELVKPQLILTLGGVAVNALLGGKHSVLRIRGQWQLYHLADGTEIPLLPSLHPAYLLRAPLQKKRAWADFLAVKMRLRALSAAAETETAKQDTP